MMWIVFGLYFSFYEVALMDYVGMMFMVDNDIYKFISNLVGFECMFYKVKWKLFFYIFWCIVQVSFDVVGLIEFNLIVNFNEFN